MASIKPIAPAPCRQFHLWQFIFGFFVIEKIVSAKDLRFTLRPRAVKFGKFILAHLIFKNIKRKIIDQQIIYVRAKG